MPRATLPAAAVYIHIGADGHTAQSLSATWPNIMASHEALLTESLGLAHSRTCRYCKPIDPAFLEAVNSRKPTTMEALADVVWFPGERTITAMSTTMLPATTC